MSNIRKFEFLNLREYISNIGYDGSAFYYLIVAIINIINNYSLGLIDSRYIGLVDRLIIKINFYYRVLLVQFNKVKRNILNNLYL